MVSYLPIYEFRCVNNHSFIVSKAIGDDLVEPGKCEFCSEDLVRVFGVPSVQFKGSGWVKNEK